MHGQTSASKLARPSMVDADENKLLFLPRNTGLSLITQMPTQPSDCLNSFLFFTLFYFPFHFISVSFLSFSLSPVFSVLGIKSRICPRKGNNQHLYLIYVFIPNSLTVLGVLKKPLASQCFIVEFKQTHPLSKVAGNIFIYS